MKDNTKKPKNTRKNRDTRKKIPNKKEILPTNNIESPETPKNSPNDTELIV